MYLNGLYSMLRVHTLKAKSTNLSVFTLLEKMKLLNVMQMRDRSFIVKEEENVY